MPTDRDRKTHPLDWVGAAEELNQKRMMTSSNGNIFRVTGPLCGEFTGTVEFPTQRPVTRSFDVFFDLRLNKRLSKQPWGWWFETPSWSLWRHCNGGRPVIPRRKQCHIGHRRRHGAPFAIKDQLGFGRGLLITSVVLHGINYSSMPLHQCRFWLG